MENVNLRGENVPIDYYCFATKTGDISVFTNLEQYSFLIEKEHYGRTLKEVLQAQEKGKLVLFDLKNNRFVDENGKSVDISEKIIFPRSTIAEADLLMENIEKANGKSITARKDYEIVENWFEKVKTKRTYKLSTIKEVEENLDDFEKQFGKKGKTNGTDPQSPRPASCRQQTFRNSGKPEQNLPGYCNTPVWR